MRRFELEGPKRIDPFVIGQHLDVSNSRALEMFLYRFLLLTLMTEMMILHRLFIKFVYAIVCYDFERERIEFNIVFNSVRTSLSAVSTWTPSF